MHNIEKTHWKDQKPEIQLKDRDKEQMHQPLVWRNIVE